MNLKKALAVLLTAAQVLTLAAFSAAAEPDDAAEQTAVPEITETADPADEPEIPEISEIPEIPENPLPDFDPIADDLGPIEELVPVEPGDPVDPERVWVRRIELNVGNDLDLLPTEGFDLHANVIPAYASDTALSWWSDDENIVRLYPDDMGHNVHVETGLEQGDVWIHCASNDGRAGYDVNVHVRYNEDYPWNWEDYVTYQGHT